MVGNIVSSLNMIQYLKILLVRVLTTVLDSELFS